MVKYEIFKNNLFIRLLEKSCYRFKVSEGSLVPTTLEEIAFFVFVYLR